MTKLKLSSNMDLHTFSENMSILL